ncbi:MAG: hypothetical protein ACUVRZ_00160 [Desulfobacca sp.]|uniref:hypothetical protein n=1 Tax=Desulfobacca sp. TaxID=2067990 RepID=UPI00404B1939
MTAKMITTSEFRSSQYSIPLNLSEELPACCSRCRYLSFEEFTVCFLDAPFYYSCAYRWADNPADSLPPCLAEPGEAAESGND